MDPSALSVAARALRSHLVPGLGLPAEQILIGHPAAALKEQQAATGKDLLNLFFYRVEPGAYPSAGDARDPLYLRLHCLLTAFAEGSSAASGGETELRILGRAIEALHAAPLLPLADADDRPIALLQAVPVPLTLDDINHLWATQGETPYRLSAAYELALLPAPLAAPLQRAPRVGAAGLGLQRAGQVEVSPAASLHLAGLAADTSAADWAPRLAWRLTDGTLVEFQALPQATLAAQPTPALAVHLAGAPGDTVRLMWSGWTRASGWQPIPIDPPPTLPCQGTEIRATALPAALSLAVPTPLPPPPAQLQVHAERDWTDSSGRPQRSLSAPLLLSLHGGLR